MKAPRSFRGLLMDLREAARPFYGQGCRTFHPVKVRPSLAWALVPRPRDREDKDPDRPRRMPGPRPCRTDIGRLCRGLAAQPLGLVDGAKFDAPEKKAVRRGLLGLTHGGARFLEDFCALVREDRYCYGMWTVTLPVEVARELDRIPDGLQRFGDVLRRRFAEALKRAAAREAVLRRAQVPDHWAFVIEPQKAGRPHWHFVFRCKARRGTGWLLGKGQLDRLIRNSFRTVTGTGYPVKAAGNVQALRRDPGSYLSKYLRKTKGQNAAEAVLRGGWSLNLVPHQWWGASRSAGAFVAAHIWELPTVAVNWLSRQWPALVAVGALDAVLWQPETDGAPAIVCGRWRSPDHLLEMLDHLLQLSEHRYRVGRNLISRNGCPDPGQHPEFDQHL